MKYFYLLVLVFVLFSIKSNLYAQLEQGPLSSTSTVNIEENLQKGANHIGLQGLSFGWGHGRVIASAGVRYGYFIADKNLLFVDFDFSTYGNTYNTYKVGLNYRKYFTNYLVKPFAQIGVHRGWENFYEDKSSFWEMSLGGGGAVQVGRFSFELGMQMNIRDKINLSPMVGVSFRF